MDNSKKDGIMYVRSDHYVAIVDLRHPPPSSNKSDSQMASTSCRLLTPTAFMPSLGSRCQLSRTRSASRHIPHRFLTRAEQVRQPLFYQLQLQQSTDDTLEVKKNPVKYTGPPLSPLKIPNEKFFAVLGILLGGALRTFSGVFVEGYGMGFRKTPAKEGEYKAPLTFFGRELEETNKILSFERPKEPIVIYEFEACPFCKKVREAATRLDLDIMFYPTPRNAPHHRPKVKELGGKEQFPYMIDSNTGTSMYESDAIIEYLYKEYGNGEVPLVLRLGILTALTCGLASIGRIGRGSGYRKAKYPDQPLVFWGYELSPFSTIVREVLVELELPFLQIYCARGSPKRQRMVDTVGVFQAPYLEDPNTGTKLFESVEIIKYLENTYCL